MNIGIAKTNTLGVEMLEDIVLRVTPELSEKVQKIAFANGYSWRRDITIIQKPEKEFLYFSNTTIRWDDVLCTVGYTEVSTYAFIASQGQVGWLPDYMEEAEFSSDGENWVVGKFMYYLFSNPEELRYSVFDKAELFKFCREITYHTINFGDKDITIPKEVYKGLKTSTFTLKP